MRFLNLTEYEMIYCETCDIAPAEVIEYDKHLCIKCATYLVMIEVDMRIDRTWTLLEEMKEGRLDEGT